MADLRKAGGRGDKPARNHIFLPLGKNESSAAQCYTDTLAALKAANVSVLHSNAAYTCILHENSQLLQSLVMIL